MFSYSFKARLLMPKLVFVVRNTSPDQQKEELAEAACHRNATANDINEGDIVASTAQIPETPVHFPSFHLSVLPPTTGIHRSNVRALLVEHVKDDFRHHVVNSWAQAAPRQVVIIGCQSTAYLRRLLSMGDEYSFLIMDRMLSRLLTAAESLVPEFGPRTQFVRSDAFFLLQQLLPPSVADTCVVPMPVPFWSEQSSHQRLVTRDFFCVIHRILKERESPTDPRGFVTFTDAVPLAEFMMEQLMESRLIVPWVRKNPAETYGRWLPLVSEGVNDEFSAQRRLEGLTALAASKSGPTSPQADAVIQSLEYKRRYYRALSFPAEG
ncbi:hypothetical protein, conserved [Trypanosoma brucei gambiense DAL972]|uniref:Uncharacterized protein n=1 Tax=Trypanosoma brucei gambiense (strain MHOM/CI/86/DAL972) TaxID=679716 RepID=C9ZPX1_TRYB9|nr:hypothetical protein, conserved [Trypanosoma brucei gambiense DAL972]CBH11449.1 hypothetical protein, conserved [Trypanosoma brucei gambiense DAL972]|eukprot:XP_011773736.1 hypothetical protein, conserved [Trypanosoma brucei gambiense DAL972]